MLKFVQCLAALLLHLVKNVVLAGFGDITLLDLDTIDLSNLNRQFLFRKKDVKQPKAIVRTFWRSLEACRLMSLVDRCTHSLKVQPFL